MSRIDRDRFAKQSANYLSKEIELINPRAIVVIGKGRNYSHYRRFIEDRNVLHRPIHIFVIRHYARVNSKKAKRASMRDFGKLRKWYDQGATRCVIVQQRKEMK